MPRGLGIGFVFNYFCEAVLDKFNESLYKSIWSIDGMLTDNPTLGPGSNENKGLLCTSSISITRISPYDTV